MIYTSRSTEVSTFAYEVIGNADIIISTAKTAAINFWNFIFNLNQSFLEIYFLSFNLLFTWHSTVLSFVLSRKKGNRPLDFLWSICIFFCFLLLFKLYHKFVKKKNAALYRMWIFFTLTQKKKEHRIVFFLL